MAELMYYGYHLLGASIGQSCCFCFASMPVKLLCKGRFFYYIHRILKQLVAMQLLARGLTCTLAHLLAHLRFCTLAHPPSR